MKNTTVYTNGYAKITFTPRSAGETSLCYWPHTHTGCVVVSDPHRLIVDDFGDHDYVSFAKAANMCSRLKRCGWTRVED